jgi:hypothetical protein
MPYCPYNNHNYNYICIEFNTQSISLEPILRTLVEKLCERNDNQRQITYQIIELAKTKLNAQQKNYLLYGLLLHKLHSAQNQSVRFDLMNTINKICQHREMDYQTYFTFASAGSGNTR